MTAINPNTLTGFLGRYKPEGLTDDALGFRSGTSNVATGLLAPDSVNGGWAPSEGVASTWRKNNGDGPTQSPIGLGVAFQNNGTTGAAVDSFFIDGTNRIAPGRCTLIVAIRNVSPACAVSGFDQPGTLSQPDVNILQASYFTENFTLALDGNMVPKFTCTEGTDDGGGGGNQAPTANRTVTCTPAVPLIQGLEYIVFVGTATSLNIGKLLPDGTVNWSTLSGIAPDHGSVGCNFFTLGGQSQVIEEVILCNQANTLADAANAALFIRGQREPSYVVPAIQIDVHGDSISNAVGSIGCAGWAQYLDNALRVMGLPTAVVVRAVNSSGAACWKDDTFARLMLKGGASLPSITKRIGLRLLGTNELAQSSPPAAATWIADCNAADAKYREVTGATDIHSITPLCCAFQADLATTETARRAYRAIQKLSASPTSVIDTDLYAPLLTPQGTSNDAVALRAGSLPWQTASRAAKYYTPNANRFTGAVWNNTSKTLTHATFGNATFSAGDIVRIDGGTGWSTTAATVGAYKVASQSTTALTLTKMDGTAINIAGSSDLSGYIGASTPGEQMVGTYAALTGRPNGVNGLHPSPLGHFALGMAPLLAGGKFAQAIGAVSASGGFISGRSRGGRG